jgi:hypothetical protein
MALAGGLVLLVVAVGFALLPGAETKRVVQAPITAPKGRVTVEVLNGTQRQGAARTATRMLRRSGLDVVFLGNADSMSPKTRVLARRGDSVRARYVAAALGSGAVAVEIDTFRRVDVSVILGDDFRPSPEIHP